MNTPTRHASYAVYALTLLIFSASARADIITLRASPKKDTNTLFTTMTPSKTVQITANQIAKINHFYCFQKEDGANFVFAPIASDKCILTVVFEDVTINYSHSSLFGHFGGMGSTSGAAITVMPEFVGPATIQIVGAPNATFSSSDGGAICTIEITDKPATVGANEIKPPTVSAIVIPDQSGPAEIILESSTDMQATWQPAALGVYGTAAKKRFFRLRAAAR